MIEDEAAAERLARAIVADLRTHTVSVVSEVSEVARGVDEGRRLYRSRTPERLHAVFEDVITEAGLVTSDTPTTVPRDVDIHVVPGLGRIRMMPVGETIRLFHDDISVQLRWRHFWGRPITLIGESGVVFEARLVASHRRSLPDLVIGAHVLRFGVDLPSESLRTRISRWFFAFGIGFIMTAVAVAIILVRKDELGRFAAQLLTSVVSAWLVRRWSSPADIGPARLRWVARFCVVLLGGSAAFSAAKHAHVFPTPAQSAPHAAAHTNPALGTLRPEVIRQTVASHLSEVRACYERALDGHPGISGRVAVRFEIGRDGKVRSADVAATAGSVESAPELARCIVDRVRTWNFPPPDGGGFVRVTYPFTLNLAPPD